jgi:hypothetical protein
MAATCRRLRPRANVAFHCATVREDKVVKALPPNPRHRLETILVKRPRCPRCDGIALRKYRSVTDQGDGSALAWVRCANPECMHRFRIVLE